MTKREIIVPVCRYLHFAAVIAPGGYWYAGPQVSQKRRRRRS